MFEIYLNILLYSITYVIHRKLKCNFKMTHYIDATIFTSIHTQQVNANTPTDFSFFNDSVVVFFALKVIAALVDQFSVH